MGTEWEDEYWRLNGRTGDGAAAPQYANRRDRNRVRRHADDKIGQPGIIAKIFKKKKKS